MKMVKQYIQFSKTEYFLPSRWSVQAHDTNLGAPAKLMMTSSAVKWAWVRGAKMWPDEKNKKLDAFFYSALVQSKNIIIAVLSQN